MFCLADAGAGLEDATAGVKGQDVAVEGIGVAWPPTVVEVGDFSKLRPRCAWSLSILSPALLRQDLNEPVRPMDANPLPILDQLGGILHAHDGRQAVLACDYRAVGH